MSRHEFEYDALPCGYVLTGPDRRIVAINAFVERRLGWREEQLLGQSVETMFTPASRLFCDSYVFPLLVMQGGVEELQLTCAGGEAGRLPVVVNVKARPCGGAVWCLFVAERREKLLQELAEAQGALKASAEELERQSRTDFVTGLPNRRAFEDAAGAAFARAREANQLISVVILDIDYFKRINDTLGHESGDEVLRGVGALLKMVCRKEDIVARLGGDEFVMILPDAGFGDAEAISRRLQNAAQAIRPGSLSVTLSIGVAVMRGDNTKDAASALRIADTALYQAKRNGRKRTEILVHPFVVDGASGSELAKETEPAQMSFR